MSKDNNISTVPPEPLLVARMQAQQVTAVRTCTAQYQNTLWDRTKDAYLSLEVQEDFLRKILTSECSLFYVKDGLTSQA